MTPDFGCDRGCEKQAKIVEHQCERLRLVDDREFSLATLCKSENGSIHIGDLRVTNNVSVSYGPGVARVTIAATDVLLRDRCVNSGGNTLDLYPTGPPQPSRSLPE